MSAPAMEIQINSLQDLLTYLQAQVASGSPIALDSSFLSARVTQLMQTDLGVAGLSLSSTGASAVMVGQTVFLYHAKSPATPFLKLESVPVDIAFQQVTTGNQSEFNFILCVTCPDDWALATSFPRLAPFPLDQELTVASPFLYFSTFQGALQPMPALPQNQTPGTLGIFAMGVNYYGTVQLKGPLEIVATIAGIGDLSLPMYGLIDQTHTPPAFDLHAPLTGVSSVNLHFSPPDSLPVSPFAGLMLTYTPMPALPAGSGNQPALPAAEGDAPTEVAQPALYLGADFTVGGVGLVIRAFVTQGGSAVLVTISGQSGSISLTDIANMLTNGSASSWFDTLPTDLQSVLNTVGLNSFSAALRPASSVPLSFVQVSAGTSAPWPLHIDDIELQVTLNWLVAFGPNGSRTNYVEFDATFLFKNQISFDVVVNALPSLVIAGKETPGIPTTLTLAELNQSVFGSSFGVPDDLLELTFSDFTFSLDFAQKQYSVSAIAGLDFNLFGASDFEDRQLRHLGGCGCERRNHFLHGSHRRPDLSRTDRVPGERDAEQLGGLRLHATPGQRNARLDARPLCPPGGSHLRRYLPVALGQDSRHQPGCLHRPGERHAAPGDAHL